MSDIVWVRFAIALLLSGATVLAAPAEGQCLVVPESLEFPDTEAGRADTLSVLFSNLGADSLSGRLEVDCPGSPFELLGGSLDYVLAPGDTLVADVRFAPDTEGVFVCSLETGTFECGSVSIRGAAYPPPECEISPGLLDFGRVALGADSLSSVVVTNAGGGRLLGSWLSEDCPDFSMVESDLSFDLGAGESDTFTVRFAPGEDGVSSCAFTTTLGCAFLAEGEGYLPPACEIVPLLLEFGEVQIGSSAERSFTIRNTGGELLEGTVEVDCPGFTLLAIDPDYTLGPGQSRLFRVRFAPDESGPASCAIAVGNDLCPGVSAEGRGYLPPECAASPDTLDLGSVELGDTASGDLVVTNVGEGTLVGTWELDCAGFSFLDDDLDYALGAGESDTVRVVFAPESEGDHACRVESGPGCQALVRGTGFALPICSVSPESLDFGEVLVGEEAVLEFVVRNEGGGRLEGAVSEPCGSFEILGGDPTFSLGAGESETFSVRFAPGGGGTLVCPVGLGNEDCGVVSATGIGVLLPDCIVEPTAIDFGMVEVGESVTRTLRVTNAGGGTLSGRITPECDEVRVQGPDTYSLGPGASKEFVLRYRPTAEGDFACRVGTGSGCPAVELTAIAFQLPRCDVEPSALDFGVVEIGSEARRELTIRNTGGGTLEGVLRVPCEGFELDGAPEFRLGAGDAVVFEIVFRPLRAGAFSCSILTGVDLCPEVDATGTGSPAPVCSVDPTTLEFPEIEVGSSVERSVTLKNIGGGTLAGVAGEGCGPFVRVGAGDYSLAAGESIVIPYRFAPEEAGTFSCVVALGDLCADVIMQGEALPVPEPECEVTPRTLSFGQVEVGRAVERALTIRNAGGGLLVGSVIVSCPDFSLVGSGGYELGPGETREIRLRFQPSREGPASCQVEVGPECGTVAAIGTGAVELVCEVKPSILDFGRVEIGESTEESFLIRNLGSEPLEGSIRLENCPGVLYLGSASYRLEPGAEEIFRLRFEPAQPGSVACFLETGQPGCETVEILAVGERGPRCAFSVPFVDFGQVEAGRVEVRDLTVTNEGGGVLAGTFSLDCALVEILDGEVIELSEGESSVVRLRLTADGGGDFSCDLAFAGGTCPDLEVRGQIVAPPAAVCVFEPQTVDFGSVPLEAMRTLEFLLRNEGNAPLTEDLVPSCPELSVLGDASVSLQPGESQLIELRFQPTSLGPLECQVTVGDCGALAVRGRGEPAPQPICDLSTGLLDFGSAPIGESRDLAVTLRNAGGGRLEGSARIACSAFRLLDGPEFSIGAGEEISLRVRFEPTDAPEENCALDLGMACGTVSLRGRGTSGTGALCRLEPPAIDFGDVEVGAVAERVFRIENDGTGILVGAIGPVPCPDFDWTGPRSYRLGPGEAAMWTVRFLPREQGSRECLFPIGESCGEFPIQARAIPPAPPRCELEEPLLDFGLLRLGESATRELSIRNAGGGVLRGVFEPCPPFRRVEGTAEFALGMGESARWMVEVSPSTSGAQECSTDLAGCRLALQAFAVDASPSASLAPGGWELRALGVAPPSSDPLRVFRPLLDARVPFEAYRWSAEDSAYTSLGDRFTDLGRDVGFWLRVERSAEWQWEGEPVTTRASIELATGETDRWHQIAHPLQVPLPVGALRVDDGAGALPFLASEQIALSKIVWGWNGSRYAPVSRLEPYRAYWMETRGGDPRALTLIVDPATVESPPPPGLGPAWQVSLRAEQAGRESLHLSIGALVSGRPVGELDLHAPPAPPAGALDFHILRGGARWAASFPQSAPTLVWDLVLEGVDRERPVFLELSGELPEGARCYLTQWDRRLTRRFSEASALRIDPLTERVELRLVAAFDDDGTVPPEAEPPVLQRLGAPYAVPNPFVFETEIRFALPEAGDLHVSIFDPQGRLVREVMLRNQPAGEARIPWDGTDNQGDPISTGIFLVRFQSASGEATLRLVRMN